MSTFQATMDWTSPNSMIKKSAMINKVMVNILAD